MSFGKKKKGYCTEIHKTSDIFSKKGNLEITFKLSQTCFVLRTVTDDDVPFVLQNELVLWSLNVHVLLDCQRSR